VTCHESLPSGADPGGAHHPRSSRGRNEYDQDYALEHVRSTTTVGTEPKVGFWRSVVNAIAERF
jgi:hypothetical protein